MGRKIIRRRVIRATRDGGWRPREERLAGEEPLEIRFGYTSYTTSMRTPGDDFDMVAGFLVGEGVIRQADQLVSMRYCAGTDEEGNQTFNVIEVHFGPGATPPDTGRRAQCADQLGLRYLRHQFNRRGAQEGRIRTGFRHRHHRAGDPAGFARYPARIAAAVLLPRGECMRRGCFPPPANC